MNNYICISIPAEKFLKHRELLENKYKKYLVEVRMDKLGYIDMLRDELIRFNDRLILTIRTLEEGGGCNHNPHEILEAYRKLMDIRPRYIDIGIAIDKHLEIKDQAENLGIKVIISYHNPYKTPSLRILRKIYKRIIWAQPHAAKIVTMARTYDDNIRVLRLLAEAEHRIPLTAFCMGKFGRISRIIAPLLGSHITYLSLSEEEATAPGQLTINDYNRIMEVLHR